MNIPLCIPNIGEEELSEVKKVLDSGWLAHGPKTKEFEEEFAKYISVKNAVSVNSGTSALQLAIKSLNKHGEIIVPSFTFVASVNAIINADCKPVFADIKYDTCNIDPADVKKKVTSRTIAIMPVHYAGQACEMSKLIEISEKNNLEIIEDSAETIGGTYKDKKTGSFGIANCFSFYPTKNITCGEGGMVTTDDKEIASKIATLKAHGISSSAYEREKKEKPWLRIADLAGFNYRLCDILAAIGLVQLKRLDKMNEARRKHAVYLNKNLDFEYIDLPVEQKDCKHVYQMYTIKVSNKIDRTKFVLELRKKGIGASVHFDPPVHLQSFYANKNYKLPVTEKVANSIVTLPMYPQLKKEELDFVIESVKDVLKICKKGN